MTSAHHTHHTHVSPRLFHHNLILDGLHLVLLGLRHPTGISTASNACSRLPPTRFRREGTGSPSQRPVVRPEAWHASDPLPSPTSGSSGRRFETTFDVRLRAEMGTGTAGRSGGTAGVQGLLSRLGDLLHPVPWMDSMHRGLRPSIRHRPLRAPAARASFAVPAASRARGGNPGASQWAESDAQCILGRSMYPGPCSRKKSTPKLHPQSLYQLRLFSISESSNLLNTVSSTNPPKSPQHSGRTAPDPRRLFVHVQPMHPAADGAQASSACRLAGSPGVGFQLSRHQSAGCRSCEASTAQIRPEEHTLPIGTALQEV